MKKHKNSLQNVLRKGRKEIFLPFFIAQTLIFLSLLTSCGPDISNYGKVSLHNTAGKESFIFSVSQEFIAKNSDSKKLSNIGITKAESKLLSQLLKKKKYCMSGFSPKFKITSRQERIFDMTFAHMIEQNYNSKPVTPRKYYGQCLK